MCVFALAPAPVYVCACLLLCVRFLTPCKCIATMCIYYECSMTDIVNRIHELRDNNVDYAIYADAAACLHVMIQKW